MTVDIDFKLIFSKTGLNSSIQLETDKEMNLCFQFLLKIWGFLLLLLVKVVYKKDIHSQTHLQ